MIEQDDPIEQYLDQLLLHAPGTAREVRRTLAEAEDHLLESAQVAMADGLGPTAARAAAVQRFGPVAGAVDRVSWLRPPRAIRRQLVLAAALLVGWGGLALGLAGAIALSIKAIWGPAAIATAFPTGAYSGSDCARWLRLYPGAGDCRSAMIADHADDFLRNAAAALVLGLLAIGLRTLLKRRWTTSATWPAATVAGAGLALLGCLGCAGIALDAVTVTHGQGVGQPIALATAAGVVAFALLVRAGHESGRPLANQRPA